MIEVSYVGVLRVPLGRDGGDAPTTGALDPEPRGARRRRLAYGGHVGGSTMVSNCNAPMMAFGAAADLILDSH
jgi:hypothetical protein